MFFKRYKSKHCLVDNLRNMQSELEVVKKKISEIEYEINNNPKRQYVSNFIISILGSEWTKRILYEKGSLYAGKISSDNIFTKHIDENIHRFAKENGKTHKEFLKSLLDMNEELDILYTRKRWLHDKSEELINKIQEEKKRLGIY